MFLVIDGEAEQEILVSVEQHLVQCPGCAQELEYARRFVAVLRERCRRASAPDQLRERILHKLRQSGLGGES